MWCKASLDLVGSCTDASGGGPKPLIVTDNNEQARNNNNERLPTSPGSREAASTVAHSQTINAAAGTRRLGAAGHDKGRRRWREGGRGPPAGANEGRQCDRGDDPNNDRRESCDSERGD